MTGQFLGHIYSWDNFSGLTDQKNIWNIPNNNVFMPVDLNDINVTCEETTTMGKDTSKNPSRVALSVARRSADRRVAGSSPGRNASRRCTRSATL